jgi:hypothetical protein
VPPPCVHQEVSSNQQPAGLHGGSIVGMPVSLHADEARPGHRAGYRPRCRGMTSTRPSPDRPWAMAAVSADSQGSQFPTLRGSDGGIKVDTGNRQTTVGGKSVRQPPMPLSSNSSACWPTPPRRPPIELIGAHPCRRPIPARPASHWPRRLAVSRMQDTTFGGLGGSIGSQRIRFITHTI